MIITCKNRINLNFKTSKLLLDPKIIDPKADCIFISHGHTDHLPTSRRKPPSIPPIICSEATAKIFEERKGYSINHQSSFSNDEFSIVTAPNGHTYDSTVAVITDLETQKRIVYTGDINIENRAYMKGFKPIKCDILIIEGTWGDKNYTFPSFDEQVKQARNYVQNALANGHPVALLGYPLGKSQLLNYSFGDLCENRFSSNSIWKMEQIHKDLGLELFETKNMNSALLEKTSNKKEPWLLFYNHIGRRDVTLRNLKNQYNLKVVGFSGWAKNKEGYKIQMGADEAFTISDHSDYQSLLNIVKASKPERIYTVFGDAKQFARDLQKDGFNATPLVEGQATLESFFG